MVAARIVQPDTKLATTRRWHCSTLAEVRIPVNVTADSGNVTGIPVNVTGSRCCAF